MTGPSVTRRPLHVLLSYSHEDEPFRNALARHVKAMEREGRLLLSWDYRINQGRSWRHAFEAALATCDAAIFLISSYFFESDACDSERNAVLQRSNPPRIYPVLVGYCAWHHTWVEAFGVYPRSARSIASHTVAEECNLAWVEVVDTILNDGMKALPSAVNDTGPSPRDRLGTSLEFTTTNLRP